MLTCKEFLAELSDYLDASTREEMRARLERHLEQCPNCWVVCDTTRKTIQVYRGVQSCEIPEDVHERLMEAFERRAAARRTTH